MSEIAVRIQNVTKEFPGVKALDDVSFDIKKGNVHCIIGENGAGKSTLMKILSGAYSNDSGTIELFGSPTDIKSPQDALNAGIGIVHQELSNFPHLDVASNLFVHNIPTRAGIIDYKELYSKSREVLDSCGFSNISERALMKDLSLGSQQMVEIAGLLNKNAQIVILDEPTSALTLVETEHLFRIIDDLKNKGITVIYISHKLEEIITLADEITVLKDGKHMITMPKTPDTDRNSLIKYMVGRDVQLDYRVGESKRGDVILEAKGLSSGTAVRDINFKLHRGEILGIAGLEGAGRTELLETLFGWRPKTGGDILIDSKVVNIESPMGAKKHNLAYITKERKQVGLFPLLDVKENISATNTEMFAPSGIIRNNAKVENANKYVDAMQIKVSGLSQKVMNLSGGNQQKVLLSMWLTSSPDIILIDEPTRGVDVGAKAEIHNLIREIVSEGKAVIMVSSEMPEIMASCDRVLVMHEGGITGEFDNEELTEELMMKYASGIA